MRLGLWGLQVSNTAAITSLKVDQALVQNGVFALHCLARYVAAKFAGFIPQ